MARKYRGGGHKPPQREPEHKLTLPAKGGKVPRKTVAAPRPPRPPHITYCTKCHNNFETNNLPKARDCPAGWRCLGGRKPLRFRCPEHLPGYNNLNPHVQSRRYMCNCGNTSPRFKHMEPPGWIIEHPYTGGFHMQCPRCDDAYTQHRTRLAAEKAGELGVHTRKA